MVVIVWELDLQLPVQSVSITIKIVSFNPTHGEVYSIQHYVIKFAYDLRQVSGFLTNKSARWNEKLYDPIYFLHFYMLQ